MPAPVTGIDPWLPDTVDSTPKKGERSYKTMHSGRPSTRLNEGLGRSIAKPFLLCLRVLPERTKKKPSFRLRMKSAAAMWATRYTCGE